MDSKKATKQAKGQQNDRPQKKRIAVIPGDGIGQEVIPQAVKVIQAVGAAVELS